MMAGSVSVPYLLPAGSSLSVQCVFKQGLDKVGYVLFVEEYRLRKCFSS